MRKPLSDSLFQRVLQDLVGKSVTNASFGVDYTLDLELSDTSKAASDVPAGSGAYTLSVDGQWMLTHDDQQLTTSTSPESAAVELQLSQLIGLRVRDANCRLDAGETVLLLQDGYALHITDSTHPITWTLVTQTNGLWLTLEKTTSLLELRSETAFLGI